MLVIGNISFTTEKKVVDIGPLEIHQKQKKTISWPNYAGVIAIVAGAVAFFASGRKNSQGVL